MASNAWTLTPKELTSSDCKKADLEGFQPPTMEGSDSDTRHSEAPEESNAVLMPAWESSVQRLSWWENPKNLKEEQIWAP